MSLEGADLYTRITHTLLAAGFRQYDYPRDAEGGKPSFIVTRGVGATVNLSWRDASAEDRAEVLGQYEATLTASGLDVTIRDGYLYVAEVQS